MNVDDTVLASIFVGAPSRLSDRILLLAPWTEQTLAIINESE